MCGYMYEYVRVCVDICMNMRVLHVCADMVFIFGGLCTVVRFCMSLFLFTSVVCVCVCVCSCDFRLHCLCLYLCVCFSASVGVICGCNGHDVDEDNSLPKMHRKW